MRQHHPTRVGWFILQARGGMHQHDSIGQLNPRMGFLREKQRSEPVVSLAILNEVSATPEALIQMDFNTMAVLVFTVRVIVGVVAAQNR